MSIHKTSRLWLALAVCVCLIVGAATQAWRLGIGERGVRVGAEFDELGRLVLTGSWCDSGDAVDIRSVSISSAASTTQSCHVSFCGVDCRGDDRSLPKSGRWVYGDVPPGYVVEGECPATVVGNIYRARLGGRIGGEVAFKISGAREVEILSKSCSWFWNK